MAKRKILKEGETDINSTDIWRFAFHSDYPTYKIYSSGSITVTTSIAGGDLGYYKEEFVIHDLGYRPETFVFADFSPYPPYPGFQQVKVTDVTGYYNFYYNDSIIRVSQNADTTKQYFSIEAPENGKSLTFYYIITLDEQ